MARWPARGWVLGADAAARRRCGWPSGAIARLRGGRLSLKYVHDAPAEDEFDSYTRVASDKLLRPASSSLAPCVCQGTEVDRRWSRRCRRHPQIRTRALLDPRQLLAILGGDGAYFADVLCDVECGAGFTLTRLGDRVEARLHPERGL